MNPQPSNAPAAASRSNQPETELPTYGDFFSVESGMHLPPAPDLGPGYTEPTLRRAEPRRHGNGAAPRIFDPVVTANSYCRTPCRIPGHAHAVDAWTPEPPFQPMDVKRAHGPNDPPEDSWQIGG